MNKWIRRFLYFLASILVLLVIVFGLLQTRWAKNIIRNKLQAYVSERTHTEFKIGSIDYSLPNWVELNGVLMRDMESDTLLFGSTIRANVDMLPLLSGKYRVNKILLDNIFVNLTKGKADSVFNYQFVINAFASKSAASTNADTSTIDLSLNELALKQVRFNMLDDKTGSYTRFRVKEFNAKINNLDINTMNFDLDKIYADELKLEIRNTKAAAAATARSDTSTFALPILRADSILIKNSFVSFVDEVNEIRSENNIGLLSLNGASNVGHSTLFSVDQLQLYNSSVLFNQAIDPKKTVQVKQASGTDSIVVNDMLSFEVNEIDLGNNNIVYNNTATPLQLNNLDYDHLDISNLQLKATGTSYANGNFKSSIQQLSFADKSGFRLDTLRGYISIDSNAIALKDVVIKTPQSRVFAEAMIYPTALLEPSRGRGELPQSNIQISNTLVSKKDLDLLSESFAQEYEKQLKALGDLLINLDATGNSRQLNIKSMDVKSASGQPLRLQLSGSLANLGDQKRLAYNLNIKNITASRALIDPFVNDKEKLVTLPPVITVNGLMNGDMNRVRTNLNMNSAFGRANAKGVLVNFQTPEKMQYDMVITANELETGKWVKQDSVAGKLTGTIALKGRGFNYQKDNISASANISSFRLQRNVLNNIKLNAVLAKGVAELAGSINDELIQLSLNGKGDVAAKYPSIFADINIARADLYSLGYATDSLIISSKANVNIRNATPANLDAVIELDSTSINLTGNRVFFDSAIVKGITRNDSTIITLASPVADANLATNLTYIHIPTLLEEVMGYYFMDVNKPPIAKAPPGTIIATVALKPNNSYNAIVKDLSFKNVQLDASISNTGRDSAVKVNITGDEVQLGANKVDNITGNISGTADSLLLVLKADTIKAGNFLLFDPLVTAGFSQYNISAGLSSNDANKKQQFGIGITAAQTPDKKTYNVQLSDTLMLDYEKWSVNTSNLITVGEDGFNVADFDISNREQKVAVNSTQPGMNAPLQVDITNFKLSTITAALDQEAVEVEGLLNSNITVSDWQQTIPKMNGVLSIDSILYQQIKVGNLALEASANNQQVQVDGKLTGFGNNVNIDGNYNNENLNIKINLDSLTMTTVQAFSAGNLVRSQGNLSGPVNITGKVANPEWNGQITFNNAQTTIAQFGTFVKMNGQTIVLQYPELKFNNFKVEDSTGNDLVVDGSIVQNSNNDFVTDLSVSASNFTAMNSTAADNNTIYGIAKVSIDATIDGPVATPELTGQLTVKDGTNVTYVQEALPASARERARLIEFVDMDTVTNLIQTKTLEEILAETKSQSGPAFLNYNLNMEVEQNAKFTIILDPATRDELQVHGKGNFNVGSLPNGATSIAGTYELKGGSYELNYGPVTRRFALQEGSTITMVGDPMNSRVNIKAVYSISTAPIDLIANEIGGSTTPQAVPFKRKVPFEVVLSIDGTAAKPELSFNIVIKEDAEGVSTVMNNTIENKLTQLRSDPSEMNKQVFALLALSRFIGDESRNFFGGNGGAANLLSNSSVTGFLNAAVDQIAADLIKGVDIDINLKSVDDDPASQRTDLNVALGKTFLNDRLTISFGKNFTVDGTNPANTGGNNSLQFLPDINTSYKLSKDGRYLLRAYRRNAYEAILDGYFIETGVAFTLTMDYNKFRELFKGTKNK